MNNVILLFDASLVPAGVGIVAGVVFFFVLLAAAFIAFKMLRRTVKMALRIAIVGIILLVAVVGSISFFWLGSSKPAPRPRPAQTR